MRSLGEGRARRRVRPASWLLRASLVDRALWLAFLLALVVQAGHRTYPTNWDALAYAALALEAAGAAPADAWRRAYADVERRDPASAALLDGDAYRETVAAEAEAFRQQLPFYRSRVLYRAASAVLVRAGVAPYRALAVLNAVALAGLAVVVLLALRPTVPLAAGLLTVLVLLASGISQAATLLTPDLLTAALVVGGAVALWRNLLAVAVGMFVLAALTRPDALLIGAALLAAETWADAPHRWKGVAGAGAVIAAGLGAQVVSGGYGWSLVFQHTFFGHLTHPAEAAPVIGVADYAREVVDGMRYTLVSGSALGIALCGVGIVGLVATRHRARAAALGGAAVAHFLVFPAGLGRLYLAHAILAFVLVMETLASQAARVRSNPASD